MGPTTRQVFPRNRPRASSGRASHDHQVTPGSDRHERPPMGKRPPKFWEWQKILPHLWGFCLLSLISAPTLESGLKPRFDCIAIRHFEWGKVHMPMPRIAKGERRFTRRCRTSG
nr:hypothetical protein CFP56_33686 [Quercus suber]